MQERILVIEIEKEEHLKPVLEKIEKEYPKHKWNDKREIPTRFIPINANYIYLYNDNLITYSEIFLKNYKTNKTVTSSEFLGYTKDNVNHPQHYQGKNECIDVMVALFGLEAVKHFCKCNAYKYRFRADKKNGEEDIKKAEWYETKLIELNERN